MQRLLTEESSRNSIGRPEGVIPIDHTRTSPFPNTRLFVMKKRLPHLGISFFLNFHVPVIQRDCGEVTKDCKCGFCSVSQAHYEAMSSPGVDEIELYLWRQ